MTIVSVLALLAFGITQQAPAKNEIASTRLVIFHADNAKRHVDKFRRSMWYEDVKRDGYFSPAAETVREIDLGIGKFLEQVSAQNPDAKELKKFSEGIDRIRRIRHLYCGQFMGVTNSDDEQIVICMYSLVSDIDKFHEMNSVPYVDDGNGRNFCFYYNIKTKEKYQFRIEGWRGGPFGSDP